MRWNNTSIIITGRCSEDQFATTLATLAGLQLADVPSGDSHLTICSFLQNCMQTSFHRFMPFLRLGPFRFFPPGNIPATKPCRSGWKLRLSDWLIPALIRLSPFWKIVPAAKTGLYTLKVNSPLCAQACARDYEVSRCVACSLLVSQGIGAQFAGRVISLRLTWGAVRRC